MYSCLPPFSLAGFVPVSRRPALASPSALLLLLCPGDKRAAPSQGPVPGLSAALRPSPRDRRPHCQQVPRPVHIAVFQSLDEHYWSYNLRVKISRPYIERTGLHHMMGVWLCVW